MSTLLNKTDKVQQAYDEMMEGFMGKRVTSMQGDLDDKFGKKKTREFGYGSSDAASTSGRSGDVVYKQLMKIPEYKKLPKGTQNSVLSILMGG